MSENIFKITSDNLLCVLSLKYLFKNKYREGILAIFKKHKIYFSHYILFGKFTLFLKIKFKYLLIY